MKNKERSIYVTKWFLFGRFIYVTVNDYVPALNGVLFGAQLPENGLFWAVILEKAWAKIWGSYQAISDTTVYLIIFYFYIDHLGRNICKCINGLSYKKNNQNF